MPLDEKLGEKNEKFELDKFETIKKHPSRGDRCLDKMEAEMSGVQRQSSVTLGYRWYRNLGNLMRSSNDFV